MGAVTFSIDSKLLKLLTANLPMEIFVETGTFQGDAVEIAKGYFKEIYSIELSLEYYQAAVEKFKDDTFIKILQGDSAIKLREIFPKLNNRPALFWLDAHWCAADNTAGEFSQCPLLAEINAISILNENSVIAIDDARLFLAPPPAPHEISQWPSFDEVVRKLYQLSSKHCLMILNDNILFFPKKIEEIFKKYAYEVGVDWLKVLYISKNYQDLHMELERKEQEIKALKAVCDEREKLIIELDKKKRSFFEIKF